MYVRQPDPERQRVKIPENYSGHAFRDGSPYTDMPPPARLDLLPSERGAPKSVEPELSGSIPELNTPEPPKKDLDEKNGAFDEKTAQKSEKESKNSLFSSLLPTNFASSEHFPFGHGIGSEEILILAMMMMVFLSDKNGGDPDHELLLLLGLLLFAG